MNDKTNEWRKLAQQFDGQRMAAMVHLRTLLAMPTAHAEAARAFLAATPAEQIASVAPAPSPAPAPEAASAPRPFDAVKSFADSVLAMLDERIKTVDRATHPFNDYFGDKPETIVAAKAQASELREVRTQVRILGDRALVDLMKFRPASPSPAVEAEKLLRDTLRDAEWCEKRVHVCDGPVLQHWKLEVYLPIVAGSGMSAEQALDSALGKSHVPVQHTASQQGEN